MVLFMIRLASPPSNYQRTADVLKADLENHELLFFLSQSALLAVETKWSFLVQAVLRDALGVDWAKHCAAVLGRQTSHHLLSHNGNKLQHLDFHQSSIILVRFLSIFASYGTLHDSRDCDEDNERNVRFKDYLRYALGRVTSFRHRVSHAAHMRTVSAAEALSALRSLKTLHENLVRGVRFASVESTNGANGHESVGNSFSRLETALYYIQKMCCDNAQSHSSEPPALPSMTSSFRDVMALFAYRLLSSVGLALQPVIKRVLGFDAYERCCDEHQTTTLDLKAIYDILRRAILTGRTACAAGDREPWRKTLAIILKENCDVATDKRGDAKFNKKVRARGGDLVKNLSNQLLSAMDTLAGPHGLRNALAHSKSNQLVAKRLGQASRAGEFLLAQLTGNVSEALVILTQQLELLERMEAQLSRGQSGECNVLLQQVQPMEKQEEHLWITLPSPTTGLLGRDELLDEVLSHIISSPFSRVVLWGQPGVGKSSMAIELALRLRKTCPVQFWLPSTSLNSLEVALCEMGGLVSKDTTGSRPYDHSQAAKMFIKSKNTKNLLLIVDDIIDIHLVDHLFPDQQHHIIFTSLTSNCKMWKSVYPTAKLVEVGPLRISDSMRLLWSKCGRIKRKDVSLLAQPSLYSLLEDRLNNIPLAVELAAGVLAETNLSNNNDLLVFNCDNELCQVQAELGENAVNRGICDTVSLLLARLDCISMNLLACLSFLGQTGTIPCDNIISLLKEISPYEECPYHCRVLYTSIGGEHWYQQLRVLQELGLVKSRPGISCVSIHQLVQRAILDRIHRRGCCSSAGMLCSALAVLLLGIFNTVEIIHAHIDDVLISDLLPMAESLFNSEFELAKCQLADLAMWLARGFYSTCGDLDAACRWYRRSVTLRSNITYDGDVQMAFLRAELGAVLWRVGSLDESMELLESAGSILATRQENSELEVDDVTMYLVYENLASAYSRKGLPLRSWCETWQRAQNYRAKEMACNPGLEQLKLPKLVSQLKQAFAGPLRCTSMLSEWFGFMMQPRNDEPLFWQGMNKFTNGDIIGGFSTMLKALRQMSRTEKESGRESTRRSGCQPEFLSLLFWTKFLSSHVFSLLEKEHDASGHAKVRLHAEFDAFFCEALTEQVYLATRRESTICWEQLYSLMDKKEFDAEKKKHQEMFEEELTQVKESLVTEYTNGAAQLFNHHWLDGAYTASGQLLTLTARFFCSIVTPVIPKLFLVIIQYFELHIAPEKRLKLFTDGLQKLIKEHRKSFHQDTELAKLMKIDHQKAFEKIIISEFDSSFSCLGKTAARFVKSVVNTLKGDQVLMHTLGGKKYNGHSANSNTTHQTCQ